MRHFKTPENAIREIDTDQEFLIQSDWIELGDSELYAELNPPPTKEELKSYTNTIRDRKTSAGFTWNGYTFDSDDKSISKIIGTVSSINSGAVLPSDFTWTDADNNDIPVTSSDMVAIQQALLSIQMPVMWSQET